jgi:hypothetical protein
LTLAESDDGGSDDDDDISLKERNSGSCVAFAARNRSHQKLKASSKLVVLHKLTLSN